MPCKCKEKTPDGSKAPCPDPGEETYRQAFLRESQKVAKLSSERDYYVKAFETAKETAEKYIRSLDSLLDKFESYSKRLFDLTDSLPLEDRRKLFEDFPKRIKLK